MGSDEFGKIGCEKLFFWLFVCLWWRLRVDYGFEKSINMGLSKLEILKVCFVERWLKMVVEELLLGFGREWSFLFMYFLLLVLWLIIYGCLKFWLELKRFDLIGNIRDDFVVVIFWGGEDDLVGYL